MEKLRFEEKKEKKENGHYKLISKINS